MIFIEIRCDKCQTVGISRHCFYAHQLRQELKGQGWKCIEAGGKDYCPKCKPRRKPRRRSRTTVRLVNAERKNVVVRRWGVGQLETGRWKMKPIELKDPCEGCPDDMGDCSNCEPAICNAEQSNYHRSLRLEENEMLTTMTKVNHKYHESFGKEK